MEHILNQVELKELWNEYYALSDKIREMEQRQREIDGTICRNSCNIVASRFPHFEVNDKVKVTYKVRTWWQGCEEETKVGFFGWFHLDGHQYTEDNGVGAVKFRLYQVKKDGTRSQKSDDFFAGNIVSIEKVEE